MADSSAPGPVSGLRKLSDGIARIEAQAAGVLIFAVLVLLLANVVSRGFGQPLIWTDELAIYLMVMAAFAGASQGLARRQHIAVTLLPDMLGPGPRRVLDGIVDVVLLAILLVFAWTLWRWFDPLGVLAAEDLRSYARDSFNFLYQEPTTTLGVRKIWFWLIMPLFCIASVIHVLARFGAPIPQASAAEGTA
ncbi:TRAP transporter small permease subunit [Aquicoccus sp. SCR17]|nr:TRAP transporter small permease subunit [Carideicomes alvinocaridis]